MIAEPSVPCGFEGTVVPCGFPASHRELCVPCGFPVGTVGFAHLLNLGCSFLRIFIVLSYVYFAP